jgi:hypothetical protein
MRRNIIFLLLCIYSLTLAYSLELDTNFTYSNIFLERDRIAADSDFPVSTYPFNAEAVFTQPTGDDIGYRVGYRYDQILRNMLYGSAYFRSGLIEAEVGAFTGFLNTSTDIITPGISTTIGITLPGIFFGEIRSDRSITSILTGSGSYTQEISGFSAGFFARNAIVSFNFDQKTFQLADDTIFRESAYELETNIFAKNIPYQIILAMGYLETSKYFPTNEKHGLGSIYLKTGITVEAGKSSVFYAELLSTFFAFGTQDLLGTTVDVSDFFMNFQAGYRINLDQYSSRIFAE